MIATTIAPTTMPSRAEKAVLVSQPPTPRRAERVVDVLLEVVDEVVEDVHADLVEPDEQDVPADPQHRRDADGRQHGHHHGHPAHEAAPEGRGGALAAS